MQDSISTRVVIVSSASWRGDEAGRWTVGPSQRKWCGGWWICRFGQWSVVAGGRDQMSAWVGWFSAGLLGLPKQVLFSTTIG